MAAARPHLRTEHQGVTEELAEQLYAELIRNGYTEEAARSEVASPLEMWNRNLFKPH